MARITPEEPFEQPVRLPIEDVLDLHTFAPKEIASVVEEYLAQCRQMGISEVRLIHGKGTGTQRAIVRRLLKTILMSCRLPMRRQRPGDGEPLLFGSGRGVMYCALAVLSNEGSRRSARRESEPAD
ncbi:MAG: Smr/MutS family protein [Candidatus Methylomirabilis sp.]|nr:Smr/MutS family protein [Candidatus Methylomirabilis sp.]